ncbi:MAG: selenium-dependent molybdenum cofactor biosynthesis protein YqeB [Anaerolineales bacterium]|nr:selenium-dependent molybdenum cofactor biosynthesis protein YqeB [Anaerolineales bacterium]
MTLILIRGGGDIASGVALRLHRAGFDIVILELEQPLAVRRTVSFAEAVYEGSHTIEGVTARLASPDQYTNIYEAGDIPVLIDPNANILANYLLISPQSTIVIDARLIKQTPSPLPNQPALYIGLGPGFCAGENCHAVIETRRSHTLGRVYWTGSAQTDSGQPDGDPRRVLRAPADGIVVGHVEIGAHVDEGQLIAEIQQSEIASPFKGVLRGLIHKDVSVIKDMKIGDVDPSDDPSYCFLVSDKALAVAGGVLEAIFTKAEFRRDL